MVGLARLKAADAATLAGGLLAGLAVPAAVAGYYSAAVRLLFLSYALDVVDGWLARRYGSVGGFFLDRAFDRLSQVIAPGVLLLSWMESAGLLEGWRLAAYSLYYSLIVTVALWRLVMRGVRSLAYFSGLPLFAHALIALSSVIAGTPPDPALLLALALASAVPVPYLRRLRGQRTPSPAPLPRFAALLVLALLPYSHPLVKAAAEAVYWGVVAYAAIGPIPALAGLAPAPWSQGGEGER